MLPCVIAIKSRSKLEVISAGFGIVALIRVEVLKIQLNVVRQDKGKF